MKVVQFTEYGGPEVLHLAEVPMPEPEADKVRVRVRAASVNPADPKWRDGMFKSFMPVPFPHVVGYDMAGTVDAVSDAVHGLVPGTRVFAMLDTFVKGGYAEYALVTASHLVAIPENLDFATAAAIPTAGLTGVQMIEEAADVRAGDVVLITGATGGVGRFAMYAAGLRGARIIAAVRPNQVAEALALGAEAAITLDDAEMSGPAFNYVIDTVGGPAVARLCRRLAPGGRIFTASTTPIDPEGLAAEPVFVIVHNDPARLAELADAVASGALPVPVAKRFRLEQAAEAQILVAAGGAGGKIVLEP